MAKKSLMAGKGFKLMAAFYLAALPTAAAAEGLDGGSQDNIKQDSLTRGRAQTGGGSYGDQNRGGTRGFYGYPRHRHIDRGSGGDLERSQAFRGDDGTSPYRDSYHGSAYYGRNYGAPYFGGGYYDRGVYYRERRD